MEIKDGIKNLREWLSLLRLMHNLEVTIYQVLIKRENPARTENQQHYPREINNEPSSEKTTLSKKKKKKKDFTWMRTDTNSITIPLALQRLQQ